MMLIVLSRDKFSTMKDLKNDSVNFTITWSYAILFMASNNEILLSLYEN